MIYETHPTTPRQNAVYDALEGVVETFGLFDQGIGPDGAHYMGPEANGFAGEGLQCGSCVFFEGPRGCELVGGDIDPGGLCKLWQIPGDILGLGDTQPMVAEVGVDDMGDRAGQIPMAEYRRTDDGDVITPKLERRRASKIEIRSDGDRMMVEGYATVYGAPYDVGGMFIETIERGAAAKSAQEADVVFLFDHDGLPLARTKSGTMTLSSDDTGLLVRAELSQNSSTARDLVDAINRGDVDEMSFAFQVVRQSWNQDRSQRSISEVKLVDVSAVTYPANPATHIQIADEAQPVRSAGMSLTLARAVVDSRRP